MNIKKQLSKKHQRNIKKFLNTSTIILL